MSGRDLFVDSDDSREARRSDKDKGARKVSQMAKHVCASIDEVQRQDLRDMEVTQESHIATQYSLQITSTNTFHLLPLKRCTT